MEHLYLTLNKIRRLQVRSHFGKWMLVKYRPSWAKLKVTMLVRSNINDSKVGVLKFEVDYTI